MHMVESVRMPILYSKAVKLNRLTDRLFLKFQLPLNNQVTNFNVFMQKSMTHAVIPCVKTMTSHLCWNILNRAAERASLLTIFKWLIIV